MEYIFLWLATIIASFGMAIANNLRMNKDVADAGYKIDSKRQAELVKQLNPNAIKATLLSMLIPLFNMWLVLKETISYNNARFTILDQLNVMDVLEEMSEIEKTEYLKHPTGLNALIVPIKYEKRLKTAKSLKIDNDNEQGEIFYEVGKSLDDITILKVSGSAERLTIEDQKKKVVEAREIAFMCLIEKYLNLSDREIETLIDISNSSLDKDLSDNKEHKENTSLPSQESVLELKKALEDLKRELLEEKAQSVTTDEDNSSIHIIKKHEESKRTDAKPFTINPKKKPK